MRLYEFESKNILKSYGISVPQGMLVKSEDELDGVVKTCVVKAQLLTVGSREKFGAVKVCEPAAAREATKTLLHSRVRGEKVHSVLVEDKIEIASEYYLGITYDTDSRTPLVVISKSGGAGVEESKQLVKRRIDPLEGLQDFTGREIARESGFSGSSMLQIADIIRKLHACFSREDAKLVEVNPLAETSGGKFVAVDALIELDDDASFRHNDRSLEPRTLANRPLTERELAVRKTNETDYRGTVKYMELDGDIAFLAAGGGGSITCMDALINCGGAASNYTEYSGNPPREKVYELTKQILAKPGLRGLWIVGAIANFTRVDETMQGVVDALLEVKPRYPIVVRRSGPYEKEGLQILREAAKVHGLDITVYGKEVPMTKTARILMEKVAAYKSKAVS